MKTLITLAMFLTSLLAHGQKILPTSEGITLAQTMVNNNRHTLLVLADNNTVIEAIDLSALFKTKANMITIFNTFGFERLAKISLKNGIKAQSYSIDSLLSPAGTNNHHVASGLNYRKHADEVDSEQVPFLFVKATKATRQQDIVVSPKELLDYEIELCARPLTTLTIPPVKSEPTFGFFICGDFTDRAELLRTMDLKNMQSGRGFSTAKSKKGYFPTGPYLVISKNWQQFIANTELKLTLNGELKQKAMAQQMIWSLSTILEKAQQHNDNNTPVHTSKVTSLLPNHKISADMVFLTGTPEGVLFRPPGTGFKIKAAIKYIFTGAFTDMKLTDFVIEQYSQSQLTAKALLQPEDQLTLSANFLGTIQLKIAASKS